MLRKMNKKGFTLVEIMIVVAIIGLLAAIAIPNLLRARLNANEASAKGSLRTISTAMESYRSAQIPPVYPGVLSDLSTATPPYIDSVLGSGQKQGYDYVMTPDATFDAYDVVATPISAGVTGNNVFCVDSTGVIVGGPTGSAPSSATGACTGGAPIEG